MRTSYVTILALAIAAGVLCTAPGRCWAVEKEGKDVCAADNPREHGRFELTEERIEHIMNRLKETDPNKAAELMQLREKDPGKFNDELRGVMHEQFGKKMGEQMGPKAEGKVCPPPPPCMAPPAGPGGPREFGEGPKTKRTEGFREGPGPGGPMERYDARAEYLEWLEKNYPEDAKQLTELKTKNPELYGKQIGLFHKKHGRIFEAAKENPALADVLKEDLELTKKQYKLVKEIKAATDDNKKKELTKELETVVSSKFDLNVKRKQIAYEQMRKRLEELKKEVEKSEAAVEKWKDAKFKNEHVKARVEELVSGAEKFYWE